MYETGAAVCSSHPASRIDSNFEFLPAPVDLDIKDRGNRPSPQRKTGTVTEPDLTRRIGPALAQRFWTLIGRRRSDISPESVSMSGCWHGGNVPARGSKTSITEGSAWEGQFRHFALQTGQDPMLLLRLNSGYFTTFTPEQEGSVETFNALLSDVFPRTSNPFTHSAEMGPPPSNELSRIRMFSCTGASDCLTLILA